MAEILDARVKQKTGVAADFSGFTLLEGEFALVRSSSDGPVINYKVGPGLFDSLPWSLQVPGTVASVSPSTDFDALPAGLYLPDSDGTYDGTVAVDLTEGVTYLNWDGSTLTKQLYPINLSGYATTSQVAPLEEIVDGGSGTFGVSDDLSTYSTAYTGAGSTRINNMVVQVDSVVKTIRFNCRRAGVVSIRFFRFSEDGSMIYAYSAPSFAATVGIMEYTAGVDFDEITMRKGDMYGTYASNSIGSSGYKSKVGASYNFSGSLVNPVLWSSGVLNDTEWGIELDVEAIGLKDQVPTLNSVVFSETDPILKESSLDTDSGSITGINGIPIAGAAPTVQPVDRKATFSIVFDDGNASDLDVADKLDEYGWKCGFALKSGSFNAARYQALQDRGFEILSHSVNHEHFDETSTYNDAQAEAEMKNSLATLTAAGLSVKGWATPYSTMKPEWIPLLRKYYQYGYTVYFGTVTPVNEDGCYHTFWEELRELKRVSLESSTESDVISAIDAVVSARGFCTLYAHVYPDTLTEVEFTNILDHLKTYVDAGTADVLRPVDAVNKYYALGHKDVLDIYNLVNP